MSLVKTIAVTIILTTLAAPLTFASDCNSEPTPTEVFESLRAQEKLRGIEARGRRVLINTSSKLEV